MNKHNTKFAVYIVILGLLGGCATQYKKKTIWDGLGYTDEKISDGVYKVTYLVNALTPPGDALKFWHQRAKELCGNSDYEHDAKLTSKIIEDYNPAIYSYQTHSFPYVEGTVKCNKQ